MTRDDILSQLAAIPPTKKPVFFERTKGDAFELMPDLLEALAKVGGYATWPLGVSHRPQIDACNDIVSQSNAKIAIAAKPFELLPNNLGDPTDEALVDFRYAQFCVRLREAVAWFGKDAIGAVLIDNEHYNAGQSAVKDAALDALHNRFYVAAKSRLPHAYVGLWERGCYQAQTMNQVMPFSRKRWATGRETFDGLEPTLMCLPDEGSTRQELAKSCDSYNYPPTTPVLAWVALGAGTRPRIGGDSYYDTAWAYDPAYADRAGRWLARHPRVTRLGSVVQPEESFDAPFWPHLIAFLKGASA